MALPDKIILFVTDRLDAQMPITQAFENREFQIYFIDPNHPISAQLPVHIPSAIIVDGKIDGFDVEAVVMGIKANFSGMAVPVLALLASTPPVDISVFDSFLLAPCHPVQIVLRATALIRLAVMEQEISLRLQTLETNFRIQPSLPKHERQKRFNILFIGKASPEFMVIINALQKENVSVTAAFTSFTAFDYLYEQTFDAVVMNGLTSTEPAFSVAETMRKNAKLYHVPALLLVDSEKFEDQGKAYSVGINDVIDTSASLTDISARVLEQANFHRTHKNFKQDFGSLGGDGCLDKITGLYNAAFFNAHLSRMSKLYKGLNLPISLCLIRIRSNNPVAANSPNMEPAYKQLGGMIKNLVRLQDTSARLDSNLFAIAFPGQTTAQLKPVTERISAILECASITDIETGKKLDISLDVTLNTLSESSEEAFSA